MIIGIDPGLTGAAAFIQQSGEAHVWDTPTVNVKKSNGKYRREYDEQGMATLIKANIGFSRLIRAGIELAHAMPKQGVASSCKIGEGFGIWKGVLAGLGVSFEVVRAASWKKAMGLSSDKETSRLKAIQMFPDIRLERKKDHNRAEALLIAEYIRRTRGFVN